MARLTFAKTQRFNRDLIRTGAKTGAKFRLGEKVATVSKREAARLRAYTAYTIKRALADNLCIILCGVEALGHSDVVSDADLAKLKEAAVRCQAAVAKMTD